MVGKLHADSTMLQIVPPEIKLRKMESASVLVMPTQEFLQAADREMELRGNITLDLAVFRLG